MRASILVCAFLVGTASFAAADSRRLLDDSNSLDALLKANKFQKIGKDAPGEILLIKDKTSISGCCHLQGSCAC